MWLRGARTASTNRKVYDMMTSHPVHFYMKVSRLQFKFRPSGHRVWCSWTLGDWVHKWNLTMTGTKSVHFWANKNQPNELFAVAPDLWQNTSSAHTQSKSYSIRSQLILTWFWKASKIYIFNESFITNALNICIKWPWLWKVMAMMCPLDSV